MDINNDILFPEKIVFADKVINADRLTQDKITQVIMPFENATTLRDGSCLIVDFGKEIYGNLRVLTGQKGGGNLRITLGESVAESYYATGEYGSCLDHSIRDAVYTPTTNTDFTTPKTGFRFAKLAVTNGEYDVISVMAEISITDLERKGFFRCDDEVVNKISETAAYTATLCIQNGVIWDGVKRDRAVWIGDMHPEIMVLSLLYGNIPQMKKSLSVVRYYVPGKWINLLPSYSAWWIICLAEYYMISADAEYVKDNLGYLDRILYSFYNVVKEDGSVSFENNAEKLWEDGEFFFDWPTNFQEESKTGFSSLVAVAMEKALWLESEFSVQDRYAETIRARLANRTVPDCKFKQVVAFNYLSGAGNDNTANVLADGGGKGMTCFMGYYILTAMADSGVENILDIIKEFYGGMLSLGATSFWEDFDVEWLDDNPQSIDEMPVSDRKNIHRDYGKFCYSQLRHSLCHGWSSGVYAFFIKTVLGIIPVEAGYKKIKINPNLLGLKTAEGKVPTPYGDIYVKHTLKDGVIDTYIGKPDEIEISED